MITEANIPALLRLITNNENAPSFDLDNFDCGTFGCLFGNDMIASDQRVRLHSRAWPLDVAADEYGIPRWLSSFLFCSVNPRRGKGGIQLYEDADGYMDLESGDNRNRWDREAAINRVRKVVYYIMHKRELMYDDRGCVRETARRAEGDHQVLRQVKLAVRKQFAEPATA